MLCCSWLHCIVPIALVGTSASLASQLSKIQFMAVEIKYPSGYYIHPFHKARTTFWYKRCESRKRGKTYGTRLCKWPTGMSIMAVCSFWLLFKPESNIIYAVHSYIPIKKKQTKNPQLCVFQLKSQCLSSHSLKYSIIPIYSCFFLSFQKTPSGDYSSPCVIFAIDLGTVTVTCITSYLSGHCCALSCHGDNICK